MPKMPSGGVCAVLDYEVELMAEYIAEMTTRLAHGNNTTTTPFRKYITQIFSSTRLPSTTILLGMNYFAKRVNTMLAAGQQSRLADGEVWRLLTVGLLLGSKFLDDNTFQNRSWSEVSGIAVRDLNALEHEWMDAVNWNLYVNLDASADYNAWLKSWKEWSGNRKRQQAMASRERLAALVPAIETDVARSHNGHAYCPYSPNSYQQQVAEYERLNRLKRNEPVQPQSYRPREASWSSYQPQAVSWSATPLTPPDSGYGTPEYLNSAASVNAQYNEWFSPQLTQHADRAFVKPAYSRHQQYQPTPPSHGNAYHSRNTSNYQSYNMFGHNIWEHNVADCNCGMGHCDAAVHRQQPYFGMVHGYGQPVMG